MRLTETSFITECTHLTSFASFFDYGAEIIRGANYNVWYALPMITPSSLIHNVGFYVVWIYWLLYFGFGLICLITDHKHLKEKFIPTLFCSLDNKPHQEY